MLARVELTFAALEVGTAPMRDVFHALRMDNWLHLNARPGHDHWNAVKQEIRAAFYPDTPEWKRAVWRHAAETFTQALASLPETGGICRACALDAIDLAYNRLAASTRSSAG